MASLAAHVTATALLLPVGLRRLISATTLYLKNPSHFRSKSWYLSNPNYKNLDLYFLITILPITSISSLFLFFSLSSSPAYRFSFLHQSLFLFLFWGLTLLCLIPKTVDQILINDNFVFLLGGVVFLMEYLVIGNEFNGSIVDVAYGWCRSLCLVCGLCCLYLGVKPRAFVADFCLSFGMVLLGTWYLQSGLNLFTDAFRFKGCAKIGNQNVEMSCDLEQDKMRSVALMNLLFVGHAIGVFVLCFGVICLLSCRRSSRNGENLGSLQESHLMHPLPGLEMD